MYDSDTDVESMDYSEENKEKVPKPINVSVKLIPLQSDDRWALIVSDVQNEYISGKELQIKNAKHLIQGINWLLSYVNFDLIVYSKSAKLCNFEYNYKPGFIPIPLKKPDIYYSPYGWRSRFADELNKSPPNTKILHVLKSPNQPNSVLRAHSPREIFNLKEKMTEMKITHIFTCGLTIEDSVLLTAKEALEIGTSFILKDACASNTCSINKMIPTITNLGIKLATTTDLIKTTLIENCKQQIQN